jgi:crotonobetainyl-CoA:carnitine CoA-transferase CaiB-like acyl-CoA transferase
VKNAARLEHYQMGSIADPRNPGSQDKGLAAALSGLLVVSIEQAVAAPYATSRLAEAGARVIKIEKPPAGDFARSYDAAAHGESTHFVWLNQGKESAVLDFKQPADMQLLRAMLRRADVFIHNLAPGAVERTGFGLTELREANPRLITCAISGYGENNDYAEMRAYDNLIQGEVGVFAVTGNSSGPAKVGISICDISAGVHAYMGILEALLERHRTGRGRHVTVSLFESVADWMSVPILFQQYTGHVAGRTGLSHASIAPYGAYAAGDGQAVMISVQNDDEWVRFCVTVLQSPEIARHPLFSTNPDRVRHREALDEFIGKALALINKEQFIARLRQAQIAFGLIRSVEEVLRHPALSVTEVDTPTGPVQLPRRAIPRTSLTQRKAVPALGAHTEAIRREFAAGPSIPGEPPLSGRA